MKECIVCKTPKAKEYFYRHPTTKDKLSSRCKECQKKTQRLRYDTKKSEILDYIKTWKSENKELNYSYTKKWNAKHSDKVKEYKRNWDRKAMQNPIHRLSNNIRGNIHHALKEKKNGRKWEVLVGYTLEDLVKHLESKFTTGICWENYGDVWHVDHITPKSWFQYKDIDDPKFKECWSLTNLQPKLKIDNIKKGNRFIG